MDVHFIDPDHKFGVRSIKLIMLTILNTLGVQTLNSTSLLGAIVGVAQAVCVTYVYTEQGGCEYFGTFEVCLA